MFEPDPTTMDLPNYRQTIKKPMCLQWIEENIAFTEECIKAPAASKDASRGRGKPKKREYRSFGALQEDVALILQNSNRYNGQQSQFSAVAKSIVDAVEGQGREYKQVIEGIEEKMKERNMTLELQPILEKIVA